MTAPIVPGATIGVLGSGQLGRMFAIAARRMGYRVHTLSPDDDTPTGQVADVEVQAAYDDVDAVRRFARQVAVVTFEFENVPSETIRVAEQFAPVRPGGHVLHTTQHRLREKRFLASVGCPLAEFREVDSKPALEAAAESIGYPAVLKTAGWGYDGKGQARLGSPADQEAAWRQVAGPAVLEAYVDFAAELSVIVARGPDGATAAYGPVLNRHERHILDVSLAPAPVGPRVAREAHDIARELAERLELVGLLCVEFFLTRDDRLLVNELAPRPHNSGHYTFDACVTSQFEQQLRAICGLPLGSAELMRPAAMVNLLGDLWDDGPPNWASACRWPDVKLHLYGKVEPRPGRKMGHLTALAADASAAERDALSARDALLDRTARA